ncbi:unnamed protein product, partial [Dovyalis caffra]
MVGMVPTNIPSIETFWGSNMQVLQGLISSPLTYYFHGIEPALNPKNSIEPVDENVARGNEFNLKRMEKLKRK